MSSDADYTILRSHPDWGNKLYCYDSRSQPVLPGVANPNATAQTTARRWTQNRVLTKKDMAEISIRANGVESLLSNYSKSVEDARSHWQRLHGKVNSLRTECPGWTEWGKSPCIIREMGKMRDDLTEGSIKMDNIARARIAAFKECDFLMVNAPRADVAQQICQKKLECFNAQRKAFDEMGKYQKEIADVRSSAFEALANVNNALLAAFQMLMQAIRALLAIIQEAFKALVEAAGVAVKALGWFAKNPSAILVVGGVVGVGVLAFIARPYISILKKVVGGKKTRRLYYSRGY